MSSIGPLLVPISHSFKLNLSQVGTLIFAFSSGFLFSNIIISFFWQKVYARLFLVGGCLVFTLSLFILGFFPFLPILFIFLFTTGLSGGIVHTGLDALFSEVYGEKRARFLNFLHIFCGVGTFLGPILVGSILLFTLKWYFTYHLMGLAALCSFLLFYTQNLEVNFSYSNGNDKDDPSQKIPFTFSSFFIFLSLILGMLLYVGAEASVSSWVPMFLAEVRGTSEVLASYSVSAFWLTFILGRLIFMHLSEKFSLPKLLIMGAGGGTIFIALTFIIESHHFLILLFLGCAGLFFSGLYPTILALGAHIFPQKTGAVIGIVSTAGSSGFMFFPLLIGLFSEKVGLENGVLLIPIFVGMVALIFLWLQIRKRTIFTSKQ